MEQMILTQFVFIIYFITNPAQYVVATGWNYDGSDNELPPDSWKYNYTLCGGNLQSPIDIKTLSVMPSDGSLVLNGYQNAANRNFTIINNGHTIQINVNVKTITAFSSRLNANYTLEQFHFHWAANSSSGSEHSVDGKFHSAEIHFVHYDNQKYSSVSQASATNDSSAILVIGIFVDIATDSKPSASPFSYLTESLSQVVNASKSASMASFPLQGLLPCAQSEIYTYSGSLTTPPCAEDVNWNIFSQPVYMTEQQLELFRHTHSSNPSDEIVLNDRPIQPLNGRIVYRYNAPSLTACYSSDPESGVQSVHNTILQLTATMFALLGLSFCRLNLLPW